MAKRMHRTNNKAFINWEESYVFPIFALLSKTMPYEETNSTP